MSSIIKSHQPIEQKQVAEIKLRSVVSSSNKIDHQQIQQMLQKQHDDAARLLEEAREKAENILASAQEDKECWVNEKQKLIEEAESTGYNDGFNRGYQDSLKQMKDQLSLANDIVDHANKQAVTHVKQAEQDVMLLSFEIAKKVIGQLLDKDSEYFMSLVKTALSEVKENKEVQIAVHTTKYAVINERLSELKELLPERTNCTVYASSEQKENECVIETESGQVIASVDNQLLHLKSQLIELFQGEER